MQEKPSVDDVQALKTNGLPDKTYLGHFGIHVFTAEIFECLQALVDGNIRVKNEFQLTSGQEGLLERAKAGTAPVYSACILNGTRWDIGMPDEYLLTLAEFGRRGPYNNA
jgi:UTP-glucose-1-phosphate uridylyltransferase